MTNFPRLRPFLALAVLGQDVAVVVVGHGIDHGAIDSFSQQLTQCIVGVLGSAVYGIGDLGDPLFCIVLIGQGTAVREDKLAHQIGARNLL